MHKRVQNNNDSVSQPRVHFMPKQSQLFLL
jgi:hypothetical protein